MNLSISWCLRCSSGGMPQLIWILLQEEVVHSSRSGFGLFLELTFIRLKEKQTKSGFPVLSYFLRCWWSSIICHFTSDLIHHVRKEVNLHLMRAAMCQNSAALIWVMDKLAVGLPPVREQMEARLRLRMQRRAVEQIVLSECCNLQIFL